MQEDVNQKMKQHSLIFMAIGFSQVAVMIIFYVLRSSTSETVSTLEYPLLAVVLGMSVAGVAVGNFLYQQKRKSLSLSNASAVEKLDHYRTITIVQWALCEAPSLFSSVAFYLSGHMVYTVLFILLFVYYMYWLKPSAEKFRIDFLS
ncbi:MAG: hypothetical protein MUF42_10350 [Cytophagaceae bacterium]|jgi:hypothetical protein|nr:hypothetical protein [Cytophagaceae bacterium]